MSTLLAPSFVDSYQDFDWSAPAVLCTDSRDELEAEWAVFAAVAAALGLALAVVIYICSVCEARSFNACKSAVQNYWWRGC